MGVGSRWSLIVTLLLAASALAVSVYALRGTAHSSLNRQTVLQSMTSRLQERDALMEKVRSLIEVQPGQELLSEYLAVIRRDGLSAHTDLRRQLDTLAGNTAALATLVELYSPYAATEEYRAESGHYLEYAHSWRDRWNAVFEIFMAGGNLPASQREFPQQFAAAIRKEMGLK